MTKIYLDYAASTPIDEKVLDEMVPFFKTYYGNPSSIHSNGVKAREAIEESRESVAKLIRCKDDEIIFTSGGTESDNLAIKGVAYLNKEKSRNKGYNIITTSIEHPAVLETCKHLETQGFKVKYLPVDKFGMIDLDEFRKSISKDTFLATIMYANNEIGTIEPIKEIGKITRENNVLFHTDAVQAISTIPIDVDSLNIDLLSISAHKIYGPKGSGALYRRKGVKIEPILHGGGHEGTLRSGTYNAAGIVGLGKACEITKERMKIDVDNINKLRDILIKKVLKIEESYLNGHPEKRLVNNAHFRFNAIEGESLNLMLDDEGIAGATGSACSSTKLQASHVLLAIGLKPEDAHGSLRLSLGRTSTEEEIMIASEKITKIVEKLREMSPLWNK